MTEIDGLLDMVAETEFDTSDGVYTVAEGARFNRGLGAIESSAVHNPFLTEALLTASIQALQDEYGIPLLTEGLMTTNIMWELSRGGN